MTLPEPNNITAAITGVWTGVFFVFFDLFLSAVGRGQLSGFVFLLFGGATLALNARFVAGFGSKSVMLNEGWFRAMQLLFLSVLFALVTVVILDTMVFPTFGLST